MEEQNEKHHSILKKLVEKKTEEDEAHKKLLLDHTKPNLEVPKWTDTDTPTGSLESLEREMTAC